MTPTSTHASPLALDRHRLLAAAAAIGAAAVMTRVGLAQESTPDADALTPWKLDLNSATDTELLTVPDTGDRMTRELEEYRPYASILAFRREIGKYVDEGQVAAYEIYLYVPVDPNAADVAALTQLPGVDETIARSLIDARPFDTNGTLVAALATETSVGHASAARRYLTSA